MGTTMVFGHLGPSLVRLWVVPAKIFKITKQKRDPKFHVHLRAMCGLNVSIMLTSLGHQKPLESMAT